MTTPIRVTQERLGIWAVHNISSALMMGTTLPTRFFLNLTMMLYGMGFLLNQGSWLRNSSFDAMNEFITLEAWGFITLEAWGFIFLVSGGLGMWRVLATRSNIICAWVINALIFLVWVSVIIIRFWGIGSESLASSLTGLFLMAFWCLLRTEANSRDKETS